MEKKRFSVKLSVLFAFIAFFLVGVSVSYAQEVEPMGAVGSAYSVPDISFGVDGYPDAKTKVGVLNAPDSYVLSSTSPFTILSISAYLQDSNGDDVYIKCDDVNLLSVPEEPLIPSLVGMVVWNNVGFSVNNHYHCNEFEIGNVNELGYPIAFGFQYVEYDTRDRHVSNADIVFGLAIIIVILFIAVCGFVFNKIVGRRKW